MTSRLFCLAACLSLTLPLAGCEPGPGNAQAGWSEADKAKAAARERRQAYYRGGRYGMR